MGVSVNRFSDVEIQDVSKELIALKRSSKSSKEIIHFIQSKRNITTYGIIAQLKNATESGQLRKSEYRQLEKILIKMQTAGVLVSNPPHSSSRRGILGKIRVKLNKDKKQNIHLGNLFYHPSDCKKIALLEEAANCSQGQLNKLLDFAINGLHDYALAQKMIALGADINAVDDNGYSILDNAVLCADEKSVNFILTLEPTHLKTAFILSLQLLEQGVNRTIATAIADKVDINQIDDEGIGFLQYTVSHTMPKAASLLLQKGIVVDHNTFDTCLTFIAQLNNPSFNELLLQSYDINSRDARGYYPLHRVILKTSKDNENSICKIVAFLLDHGADVNAVGAKGYTPLHIAIVHRGNQNLNLIMLLQAADARWDILDDYGTTQKMLLELLYDQSIVDLIEAPLTAQESTWRQLFFLAHRFGLKGNIEVNGHRIDLEGLWLQFTLPEIGRSIAKIINDKFTELPFPANWQEDDTQWLLKALNESIYKTHDTAKVQQRLSEGALVMSAGWHKHATVVVASDTLLMKCNRGEGATNKGIEVHQIHKSKNLPRALANTFSLAVGNTLENKKAKYEWFNEKINEELGLTQLTHLPHRGQDCSNCSMASAKMSFRACVYLRLKQHGYSDEEAKNVSYAVYKTFTKADRRLALTEFIDSLSKCEDPVQSKAGFEVLLLLFRDPSMYKDPELLQIMKRYPQFDAILAATLSNFTTSPQHVRAKKKLFLFIKQQEEAVDNALYPGLVKLIEFQLNKNETREEYLLHWFESLQPQIQEILNDLLIEAIEVYKIDLFAEPYPYVDDLYPLLEFAIIHLEDQRLAKIIYQKILAIEESRENNHNFNSSGSIWKHSGLELYVSKKNGLVLQQYINFGATIGLERAFKDSLDLIHEQSQCDMTDILWPAYARNVEEALLYAIEKNSPKILAYLKSKGVDLSTILDNKDGAQAIHWAAMKSYDCLTFLIEAGVDVECKTYEGITPLMISINNFKLKSFRFMVAKMGSINSRVFDNCVIEMLFTERNMTNYVKCLLSKYDKNSIDDRGDNALHRLIRFAAQNDVPCAKIFTLLVNNGLDAHQRNHKGETPLDLARKLLPQGTAEALSLRTES